MRVTIDLEKEIVIIPDNFFVKIKTDNERLEKFGATAVSGIDRIKNAFEKAMNDTDNRLITQSNAKTTRAKKTITPEEAKQILQEAEKETGKK